MTSPLEQAILDAVGGTENAENHPPQEAAVPEGNSHDDLIEKLLGGNA
ncbi:hypothetical protein [Corynebacterium nasicanis]|uniref:Uncharacterized protein n=1 Tax=Corynebacterium nasicanis TaxID=1448267 RepID=A0ABW1QEE7_9CORY